MMRRTGWWGTSVPAVTFIPSASLAFANCLASLSVGNVFACLAKDVREGTGPVCFGVSTETNHRSVMIVRLAMVAAAGQLKISNNVRSDAWPQ